MINITEYISNILVRPRMYVQSAESLEDVYWVLNVLRGTCKDVESAILNLKIKNKTSNQPLSHHIKDIEEMAKIFREIENKISYIDYGILKDNKEMSNEKLLQGIIDVLIKNGYVVKRKEELGNNNSEKQAASSSQAREETYKPEF